MSKGLTPFELNKIANLSKQTSAERLKDILSKTPQSTLEPTIVLTYDDGYIEDYDAFQIHKELGVPGSSYIVKKFHEAKNILPLDTAHLTDNQMKEMHEWGWEFGAHSCTHVDMGYSIFSKDISIGDTKFYLHTPGRWKLNNVTHIDVVVEYGGKSELFKIVENGEDGLGGYVIVDTPSQNSWPSSGLGASMRLTDDALYSEIVGSKDYLESLGYPCRTFVYPYNSHSSESRELVLKHYDGARAFLANPGLFSEGYGKSSIYGVNLPIPLRTSALFAYSGDGISTFGAPEEPRAFLDEVKAKNALGIVMFHSGVGNKENAIRFVIEEALQRGIKVTTLSKALEKFGNLSETGDWWGSVGTWNRMEEGKPQDKYFEVIPAQFKATSEF